MAQASGHLVYCDDKNTPSTETFSIDREKCFFSRTITAGSVFTEGSEARYLILPVLTLTQILFACTSTVGCLATVVCIGCKQRPESRFAPDTFIVKVAI